MPERFFGFDRDLCVGKEFVVRRTVRRFLLTLKREEHVYYIVFDARSRDTLFDCLIDMAQDRDNPLTWDDIFEVIDTVGAAFSGGRRPPSRLRI